MVDRKLLSVALISSAATFSVTAVAIYAYFRSSSAIKSGNKRKVPSSEYPTELIEEQLARNIAFLGEEGVKNVRNSFVVVVGAGGVGSWAATMLVRSGVGRMRIIDFDQVTLSSLNRHACATLQDVGTPKVTCLTQYLNKVAPWVSLEPRIALWSKGETGAQLLEGKPDYVIDCIDNIDTKVDLLHYCYTNDIPVIASMGAGCKADPTRVRIGDISMSIEDPMARVVRRMLKLKGIKTGIPTIFSSEKPGPDKAKLLELDQTKVDEGEVHEFSVLKDFRVRILPVLGPLPAIFGLTIATHLLLTIGKYDSVFDPVQGGYSVAGKARTKLYDSVYQSLVGQQARIEKRARDPQDKSDLPPINLNLTMNDVAYYTEEVFMGKSVLSDSTKALSMTQWDPAKGIRCGNLILVTRDEQREHERRVIFGGESLDDVYGQEVRSLIEKRQKLDDWYQKFRG